MRGNVLGKAFWSAFLFWQAFLTGILAWQCFLADNSGPAIYQNCTAGLLLWFIFTWRMAICLLWQSLWGIAKKEERSDRIYLA
jgi:succinate-acetate transporter protein